VKNKERRRSYFGLMLSSLVLITGASHAPRSGQPIPQLSVENRPSNTQAASDNRQWRSATYRGLKVGKSTRKDMLRVLGKPKISVAAQARITTNPNTIVSFHYGGPNGYAGDLIVGIEKTTHIIVWIEMSPANLSRDDVTRQFGNNYILTGYELDDCFIDGQPRTLYEASAEAINSTATQMEYRSIGIAVQFRPKQ
jgi:hypothetical protein